MKRTGSQADHGCAGGQPRRAAALICLDDEQKASLEPLGDGPDDTAEVLGAKAGRAFVLLALRGY